MTVIKNMKKLKNVALAFILLSSLSSYAYVPSDTDVEEDKFRCKIVATTEDGTRIKVVADTCDEAVAAIKALM